MKKTTAVLIMLLTALPPLSAQIKPTRALLQAVKETPSAAAAASASVKKLSPALTKAATTSWGISEARTAAYNRDPLYNSYLDEDDGFSCSEQSVILDRYDRIFSYGAPQSAAIEVPSAKRFLYIKQARTALNEPFPDITPADQLVRYYKLNPAQMQQYQNLYNKIEQFHLYIQKSMTPFLASTAPTWPATEKQAFDRELSAMEKEVHDMLAHMGGVDPTLERILTDIQWSRELVSNLPGHFVMQNIERPIPFNFKRYCLFSAPTAWPLYAIRQDELFLNPGAARATAREFCAQLPANLKVAVINDTPLFTAQYDKWKQEGIFTNGMTITTFSSLNDFLKEHRKNRFDIVLTDYFVPGGGGNLLVKLMRAEQDFTPVLLHSYAGDEHSAWQITRSEEALRKEYLMGYDGFLPTNEDFFAARGYLYVLEGLRNFFNAPKISTERL